MIYLARFENPDYFFLGTKVVPLHSIHFHPFFLLEDLQTRVKRGWGSGSGCKILGDQGISGFGRGFDFAESVEVGGSMVHPSPKSYLFPP